jgi:hypothetical protein
MRNERKKEKIKKKLKRKRRKKEGSKRKRSVSIFKNQSKNARTLIELVRRT